MNKTQKIIAGSVIALGALSIAVPANADSVNWDAIAKCESSGNWHNHDTGHNGHYGGLQFSTATWLGAGGGNYASRADYATEAEQKAIASKLSLSNWEASRSCWGSKVYNAPEKPSTGSSSAHQRSSVQKAPVKTYKAPEKVQSAPKNDVNTTFTYRIKEGDTLSFIGWYFNVDWHKIYKTNKKVIGKNPNLIYPGEVLTITVNY